MKPHPESGRHYYYRPTEKRTGEPVCLSVATLCAHFDGLEDKKPAPGPAWNQVPEQIAQQLVSLALAEPDLSPRELAVRFTEQ